MNQDNPYSSPTGQNPFAGPGGNMGSQASVEDQVKQALKDQQSKTTAWQLFATGLIGCFSPILAIYGIVFLLRRQHPFPLKGLAIAGTILHCIWTLLTILMVLISVLSPPS